MPLYSYYCKDCDRTVAEMRLMAERLQKPLPPCDRCAGDTEFAMSNVHAIVRNPAAGHMRRV